MIVTISGNSGSGKSTIAKIIVERLNYERIYLGGIMREIAREEGIVLEDLMDKAKTHPEIDRNVDYRVRDRAREIAKTGKNVLVEGRVQFYHLPESIKIYVYVDEIEGAKRIWNDLQDKAASQNRNQKIAGSIKEVVQLSRTRDETDAQRYLNLYGVDCRDRKNYDLIVDTTEITADLAAKKIINYLQKRSAK